MTVEVPSEPLATVDDFRSLLTGDVPLIDVRAPVEFAKGAFPAAINLPLMDDEERRLVGIRYKQAGQAKAIALGAQLVDADMRQARRIAWRTFVDAHPDAVLYCFRGGLRSRISQAWLAQTGVVRPLVAGGYKAMRQFLIDELVRLCRDTPFRLIAGRTGSGKTLLLNRLERQVDLEGIARHRGSSFGGMAAPQPSPIDVENAIAIALMKLEQIRVPARLPARLPERLPERSMSDDAASVDASSTSDAVWLEDEAKLIGRVCLPPVLRDAMAVAPAVVLETPMAIRVANCFDDYVPDLLSRYRLLHGDAVGFQAYAAHHQGSLERIRKRLGGVRHAEATRMLESALAAHEVHDDTSGYAAFIELLLTHYYDPMYDYQLAQKQRRILFTGSADEILDWSASLAITVDTATANTVERSGEVVTTSTTDS